MKNKKEKWKILDLFAGAGGLSNGFEQTGNFEVFGAVENNHAAADTYILNHNNDKDILLKSPEDKVSDITKINFKKVLESRKIDPLDTIILGGPPCQGFSNANRQRNNLISENNMLVKEFARAVYEIRPKAFLMENVKTMISQSHKFLVQKTASNYSDKAKPSRRRNHLEWINEQCEKFQIKLNENDYIIVGTIGEEKILQSWAEYIKYNYEKTTPIIISEQHVSIIRSLERKARKLDNFKPSTQIINHIRTLNEQFYINEEMPWKDTLKKFKEEVLIPISKGDDINLQLYHKMLKNVIFLNATLTNFNELKHNEIEFKDVEISSSGLRVTVTTYNVVDYLEAFFDTLNYRIDKGVLTASDFGVPQRRNRFFIMGVHSNEDLSIKLPKPILSNPYTVRDAIEDLESIAPSTDIKDKEQTYTRSSKESPLLNYYRGDLKDPLIFNHVNTDTREHIQKRYKAIRERGGKNSRDVLDLFEEGYSKLENIQNTVYLRLNYDEPSPTVVNVRKSMWSHPEKERAVSIREAARLQSFKDSFQFTGKKDSQYQQIGNAVPPLLARAIAEKLLHYLGDSPKKPIEEELSFFHMQY